MTKHGALLLAALLTPLWVAAQFAPTAYDARSGAMGGCLMPQDSGTCAALGWRQGYLVQGMSTRTLAVGAGVGRYGRLAAAYSHFGDADYHEQQAALAAGVRAARWLTVGVYGLYSHVGTADGHYPSQHCLDGGAILQVSGGEKSEWGGYFLIGSSRCRDSRRVEARAGLTCRPLPSFMAVAEMAADGRLRCGMEYAYERRWFARAGFSTNPLILTFGVGCRSGRYHVDLATEVHPALGLSPQISLGLCL